MSNSKTEIGINIVLVKDLGYYYQSTMKYVFFPNIHSCTRHRISWLKIDNEKANEVIEKLKLKREEFDEFVNWSCKQELKADAYLKKTMKYLEKLNLQDAVTS